MHETAVQLQMPIDMPEGIIPMAVVEVSVTTEHLLDDGFDILVVVWRKARGFADPVIVRAGEGGH